MQLLSETHDHDHITDDIAIGSIRERYENTVSFYRGTVVSNRLNVLTKLQVCCSSVLIGPVICTQLDHNLRWQ